jgi:chemotaxis protein methyltransferase CheR
MNRDGNYEILPQIKKMVKFQYLNLVEDVYPSLFNDTNAMDFIFCRNVLMYFTQEHMAKSIDRFHQCLLEKGWLLVGSSETSHIFFPQYVACNFPGAILYHKDGQTGQKMSQYFTAEPFEFTLSSEPSVFIPGVTRHEPQPSAVFHRVKPQPVLAMEPKTTVSVETAAAPAEESQYEEALALYEDGSYEAVVSKLADRSDHDPKCMTLVAKAFANQGKLNDAIAWCEKAISIEKLNPEFHHLRAVILQERGQLEDAIASLKRALYIDSNFVLAHFMLGNLSQQAGRLKESRKCFENALVLLSGYEQDTVITESDGLTAGRLKELILLMLNQEMHA